MTDATNATGRQKVGVIVAHGLGESKPGEVVSQTALGLRDHATLVDHKEVSLLLDDGEEARIGKDLKSIDRASKWEFHKQRGALPDDATFVIGELYWSDLKRVSREGVPSILRLVAVILRSNTVINALSRGRLTWTAYPAIWLCKAMSWLLRGPILGMNVVFGSIFLMLTAISQLVRSQNGALLETGAPDGGGPTLAARCRGSENCLPADEYGLLGVVAPILLTGTIGAVLIYFNQRKGAFWRGAGQSIFVSAMLVLAIFSLWGLADRGVIPEQLQTMAPSATRDLFEFFGLGLQFLLAVWVFLGGLSLVALAITLAHIVAYPFFAYARSVYRRLIIAFSIVSIQSVAWSLVTRPLWLSKPEDLRQALGAAITASGAENPIESLPLEALLYGSLVANFITLLAFLAMVALVFGLRLLVTEAAHRIWRDPQTMPALVKSMYPRLIMNGLPAHVLSIGAFAAAVGALSFALLVSIGLAFSRGESSVQAENLLAQGYSWVAIALLVIIILLMLFDNLIGYSAAVLEDIANYAQDRKHRSTADAPMDRRQVESEDNRAFPFRPLWRQVMRRFDQVADHMMRDEKVDRLVVVAHSQGTVIAFDYLDRLESIARGDGSERPVPIDVVTLGSPLKHIYAHYFPEYMEHETRISRALRSLRSWTNMYRVNEAIGRRITANDGVGVEEIAMPRGPHRDYWFDDQVTAKILEKIRSS